jgi:hypothetical protein
MKPKPVMSMNLFDRLRFRLIDFLVGKSSYIKNIVFDWNEKSIAVGEPFWVNSTTFFGDPMLKSYHSEFSPIKISEAMRLKRGKKS